MKNKKQKPQFAVVMTELDETRMGVINEKGERFLYWHSFKIGQVVSLMPDFPSEPNEFKFIDGRYLQQTLRKQDFELLP